MTKFQAINDNVIVKVENQKVTEAGLIKPFSAVNKKDNLYGKGVVVSAGQECKAVKEGDTIAFLDGGQIFEEFENETTTTAIVLLREYLVAAIIK
jgi:co-chaperonin GroES (HSP10)